MQKKRFQLQKFFLQCRQGRAVDPLNPTDYGTACRSYVLQIIICVGQSIQ